MENYKDIDKVLKTDGDLIDLNISKAKMRYLIFDLLENKISNFNYDSIYDYNYLLKVFDDFSYYFDINFENKKEFYLRIKQLKYKIKALLIEKPGNVSKDSTNFKFLKELIDNLDIVSISFLYDYVENYDGSKYDFINFLVFDVKRINLFEDALKRFPHIVNFESKNGESLIDSVINKYINEVKIYTNDKELKSLDDVIYYDEILNLILNSDKLNFDISRRNTWINDINNIINTTDYQNFNSLTKQKYVFFLNNLCNLISGIKNYDINYLKYKYDIKISFNTSVNVESTKILNIKKNNKRQNIDDIIVTIDGEGAKEIDDGLSIKRLDNGNYLLGIHIADPLYFINNNSIIYDEAKRRTTSIYLSDLTVSMFPSELSSDMASLLEKTVRPATSYYYELTTSGEVVDYKFFKSFINVYKNMTYDEFNNVLYHDSDDEIISEIVNNLTFIQPILSKFYHVDPYYERINRIDNNITSTNIIGHTISEKVVESAMIFNNHMVASHFSSKQLPFIYRVHAIDENTISKIEEFSKTITLDEPKSKYLKYINIVKNVYPKAFYSIDNKGHFGLGLSYYSHITSPLRRFADILGSECLDKLYFNSFDDKDIYIIEDDLKNSINQINQKRLSIEQFSINYEKNKYNKNR